MGYIFISYSHKDKDYVHKLHEALSIEGFDVWIDDRIDYGHEWPKVIQEHLDSCEVFIVVMSGNSYASDMVQNEVIRAREKKKHVFTLLLEGDNWLIFQAKQYVDVRGGKLPPSQFYISLEKYVDRQEVYDPLRLSRSIEHWNLYQNNKYGFSFKYPFDTEEIFEKPESVRINFPMVPGTNLLEKWISVGVMKGEPCSNPLTKNWSNEMGSKISKKKVKIGNLLFLREIGGEGNMGKWEQWVSYSTFKNGICVCMTINAIFMSDGPFHPHELPKIDANADKDMILKVASAFQWLDDGKQLLTM